MRCRFLLVAASVGCSSPPETQPTEPPAASEPAPAPAPVADTKSEPPAEPATEAIIPVPPPDLCTSLCVAGRQMQAMSAAAIEAQCKTECDAIASGPENADCAKVASQARKKADKPPMNRRAPFVWKQVNATLACGHADAVIERLAAIGAKNAKTRDADFLDALADDPFFERLCPAGLAMAREAAARPAEGRTKHLVETCPLPSVEADGAAKAIPVGALLAIETVALRWQAFGAKSSDHAILLDTLRLSTALSSSK